MNKIEIYKNLIVCVCSLMLCIFTFILIVNGEYIVSIAVGIMNIAVIQLYRLVKEYDNNE